MSGPLTSKEELEVNYRPLSRALKQLQLKPESPHRKGGMERIQGGEMERGINHGYGESDFRMQKWGENRWGEGDAGTELQGKRQWWRASRRSGTTTLDISLPLCMSRGWRNPRSHFLCLTPTLRTPPPTHTLQHFVTGSWLPWKDDIALVTAFNQMPLSFHRTLSVCRCAWLCDCHF